MPECPFAQLPGSKKTQATRASRALKASIWAPSCAFAQAAIAAYCVSRILPAGREVRSADQTAGRIRLGQQIESPRAARHGSVFPEPTNPTLRDRLVKRAPQANAVWSIPAVPSMVPGISSLRTNKRRLRTRIDVRRPANLGRRTKTHAMGTESYAGRGPGRIRKAFIPQTGCAAMLSQLLIVHGIDDRA